VGVIVKLLAIIAFIVGCLLAWFIGIDYMLIGGISDVVNAAQLDPIPGDTVAWGVVRALFGFTVAAFLFWLGCFVAGLVWVMNDD
jgi:hypothetical protein